MSARVLFLLKQNETYGFYTSQKCAGLWNSTKFVSDSLNTHDRNIQSTMAVLVDANEIDRIVSIEKPTAVVLEALWVTPEKIKELKRLHPSVKWFVHLHSHVPFLAVEGIAIAWLRAYTAFGVTMIVNSPEAWRALEIFNPVFLPNVYFVSDRLTPIKKFSSSISIGCFGAVRPMKNQLLQALAALRFAQEIGEDLLFHVNSTRVEAGGDPALKNIRALFENQWPNAQLVEWQWMPHNGFLERLESIDISMQVSLSETFNIVTADAVAMRVPVVVSDQIKWTSSFNQAKSDSIDSIVRALHRVHGNRLLADWNRWLLKQSSSHAVSAWLDWARGL